MASRRNLLRDQVLGHYGTECACCGTSENLTIDHVNGDGAEHRLELFGDPQAGASARWYLWLVRNGFPEGYQTLCRPCNASKGTGERCRLGHIAGKKRCTGECGEVKPLEAFSPGNSWCRPCRARDQARLRGAK